jgi:predicted ArsR family transcriptional regulator
MHVRAGAVVPPRKAELFDAIKASGDVGCSSYELAMMLKDTTTNTVRQHIWQLNDRYLIETPWVIKADGRGRYSRWYLARRRGGTA